jgi:hypothetical protein
LSNKKRKANITHYQINVIISKVKQFYFIDDLNYEKINYYHLAPASDVKCHAGSGKTPVGHQKNFSASEYTAGA